MVVPRWPGKSDFKSCTYLKPETRNPKRAEAGTAGPDAANPKPQTLKAARPYQGSVVGV